MPRIELLPDPSARQLKRGLWQILIVSSLLLLCLPMLWAHSAIGFLPLWLLLAPATALAVAYRHDLSTMTLGLKPSPRRA